VGCPSACAVHRPNGTRARNAPSRIAPARGALGPLRFARALDCFAICAASRRETAAHFSAIARLRSGAVASRSGAFRIAAFRCGDGGPRGWHGRAGADARRSLRHRLPVRLGVRASFAHERHPAWSEYLPAPPAAPVRRCAHPAARARSGPVPRRASAGALVAHVHFCGARPAHLAWSKVSALRLNCTEDIRMGARGVY